jgi:GNAT superfamily N-acetyltransferase
MRDIVNNTTSHRIVTIDDRPDLLPQVIEWERSEWGDAWGEDVRHFVEQEGGKTVFVMLDCSVPIGCAMLLRYDMTTRKDLSPWLGGIYVDKEYRQQGVASELVLHALEIARQLNTATWWLYTASSRSLYERLGWKFVETCQYEGETVTIMRFDFSAERSR